MAARRGDTGRERGVEHLARLARVAHDQHLRRLRARNRRGRAAQAERHFCGQEVARDAADPVGPEEAPLSRGTLH